jgi:hypothetical protein
MAMASGLSMQVSAAPIFSFTEFAGFQDDVAVADYSGLITGDASAMSSAGPLYDTMSWVSGTTPQSSLEISSATSPTTLMANTWTTISTLAHNNFVIPNPVAWSGQDVWGRLRITDSDGGARVALDSDEPISIALTETPNSAPCAGPNPNGSICDDNFAFSSTGLDSISFTANDGSSWLAEFQFANLFNAVSMGGFLYTAENARSSIDVQVRVTSRDVAIVPEPVTLGILGLGLVALSFAQRRKLMSN